MKSYNSFVNESINKFLKPKDNNIILNNMIKNKLSNDDILEKSLLNNYLYGIKYILDKNISIINKIIINDIITKVNDNEIIKYLLSLNEIKDYIGNTNVYILEKCKLGLHKNITKPYEQNIINIIQSLITYDISGTTYYYYDNNLFFIHSTKSDFITIVDSEIDKICRRNILLTYEYVILIILYYINNILHINTNNYLSQEELEYLVRNRDMIDN